MVPSSDDEKVVVEVPAGSVVDDIGRTLEKPARLVTPFKAKHRDAVIHDADGVLSCEFPELDSADQETLREGIEIYNACNEALANP